MSTHPGHRPVAAAVDRDAMKAMFRGRCAACGDWFPEGTEITHADAGWRHADCDQPEAERAPRLVCDRCWLEMSVTGRCGCDA